MSFFVPDQERVLYKLLRNDAPYAEVLEFLRGPLDGFVAERVAPRAAANDRDEVFDVENFHALGEIGFMSLAYPEAYGGLGVNLAYYNAGLEAVAKADAGFTLGVAIHGTATDGIYRFASDELKRRYVPDLAGGRRLGAFCLSEAGCGSDAKALSCTFTFDARAGEYVLNGNKYWITNGLSAEVFFVLAKGPDGEVSAFVVEKGGRGGFEQAKIKDKMGVRGSNTAELVFQDYRVPKGNLVGEPGRGFGYAMQMLNGGRITIASWSTGIAQGAYEKLLKYAHERKLFGKRLVDLDNTRRELSEMITGIHAGREMAYGAAFFRSEGKDVSQMAAEAKVFASEHAVHCGERAIELAGGYGYVEDSRIERHLRDALLGRIGEGANEVLKVVVIPRGILKDFEDRPLTGTW
ncbi:MAG: acyl-CoA dehydrogenase family protein [Planctomycetota bacterium]